MLRGVSKCSKAVRIASKFFEASRRERERESESDKRAKENANRRERERATGNENKEKKDCKDERMRNEEGIEKQVCSCIASRAALCFVARAAAWSWSLHLSVVLWPTCDQRAVTCVSNLVCAAKRHAWGVSRLSHRACPIGCIWNTFSKKWGKGAKHSPSITS